MGLIVGLTGGIGSGKSAAASLFADLGVPIVDTDVIAHELTGPGGPAMPALGAAFGPGVLAADGSLDRPAMRALAFGDPATRKRLEAILHPLIRDESASRCRLACESGAPYVILAVPLLIESGDFRRRGAHHPHRRPQRLAARRDRTHHGRAVQPGRETDCCRRHHRQHRDCR
jgi:dephospho-CoA kinase